ncbi:pseudouridine synthase [Alcanivorax sp. 1008]|uniref:pseudouridine synthase n=1 Tax=Alcanivorax sp. 1008 TaxID=2816853 RepID=UPI001DE7B002|nr:pseudouridine synthase [Alcanivorax sp. 1008]MCC1497855.1 pseudouridine synthase [Alcanivorax sp. 1008]
MRLDFYIAHATGLSRREVKVLIGRGEVSVDGDLRPRASLQLHSGQQVRCRGELLSLPGHRYLMLHKPAGMVSSTSDRDGASVLQLLPAELRRDLHIVGRLDVDTTGLLLLSSDGQWSHRITAPKSSCSKVYHVRTARPLTGQMIEQLCNGVVLRGEARPTLPAQVERLDACSLRLTIDEGRYHQIKRMLAAVGNHVEALHRERIGPLPLDPALLAGDYRALTDQEVALF